LNTYLIYGAKTIINKNKINGKIKTILRAITIFFFIFTPTNKNSIPKKNNNRAIFISLVE